ncbi:MAG: DUF393 domain-containing protein [Anaerolineae bacterium]|nr:DUF393 domain-containing protein [Anaerolineae bacterium]
MGRTVMIYDGLCGLCVGSMRAIQRLDWRERIDYLDAQDWAGVQERLSDAAISLTQEALLGLIHVVTPDGRVQTGYAGVRALLRELPPLAWLSPLLGLPGIAWLGPRVYGWIAANRYRFNRLLGRPDPCQDGACRVHAPRL